MTLHLLRHAKTNQQSETGKDFDRSLLPKGREQLAAFRAFSKEKNISISRIYCSSAKRTRESLQEINELFPNALISFHDDLYLATWRDLLLFLTALKTKENILLIGHNEGLSEVASYLSGSEIQLKTCGYIQLQFPFEDVGFISAATGSIVDSFRCN